MGANNKDLDKKFQEYIDKFSIPEEFGILGLLTNTQLLEKMQISFDDISGNFILVYDDSC